jgi:hypothetical protein
MKKLPTLVLLLALATFLGVPLAAPGCAGLNAGDVGSAALNCAKQGVQIRVGAIVGTVADLARKGGDGWEASLEQLAIGYGADVLQCAFKAVKAQLAETRAIGDAAALKRLESFEAKKGWK